MEKNKNGKLVELLSVIVPVYNAEKYIGRCIESILAQVKVNLELIVVDDGSSDKSLKILDSYARNDHRVILVHKENGGVSSARNAGLNVAKGKWVAFVDADDYLNSEAFYSLLSNSDEHTQAIMGFSIGGVEVKFAEKNAKLFETIKLLNETQNSNCGYIWHRLYERNRIGNLRFDESLSFGEDGVFWFEYVARNPQLNFQFVDYIGYNYFKGDNVQSLTSKNVSLESYNHLIDNISHAFSEYIETYKNSAFNDYLSLYIKQRYIMFVNRSMNNKDSLQQKQDFLVWKEKAKGNVLFSRHIHGHFIYNHICSSLLLDELDVFKKKIRIYNFAKRLLVKIGIVI